MAGPVPEVCMPLRPPPDRGRIAGAIQLITRLKPGDTIEQARANIAEVARGVKEHLPPVLRPAR